MTVTSGATEAIFDAMLAFLDPGDEIIFFEPFYDAYVADVAMAGGDRRASSACTPPDWYVRSRRAARGVHRRARSCFLLNTPHNPTGKVFTRAELEQIAELCQAARRARPHRRGLRPDRLRRRTSTSRSRRCPDMWERTLTINSTGKTFTMTGWKIGYAVGPADAERRHPSRPPVRHLRDGDPFQEAMAVALETAEERGYYRQLRDEYAQRRDRLRAVARRRRAAAARLPGQPTS